METSLKGILRYLDILRYQSPVEIKCFLLAPQWLLSLLTVFCKLNPQEKISEAEKGSLAGDREGVGRHGVSSTEGSSERQKLSLNAEEICSMEKRVIM